MLLSGNWRIHTRIWDFRSAKQLILNEDVLGSRQPLIAAPRSVPYLFTLEELYKNQKFMKPHLFIHFVAEPPKRKTHICWAGQCKNQCTASPLHSAFLLTRTKRCYRALHPLFLPYCSWFIANISLHIIFSACQSVKVSFHRHDEPLTNLLLFSPPTFLLI